LHDKTAAGIADGVLSFMSVQVAYIDEAQSSLLPDVISSFERGYGCGWNIL
jgi:hypothetical protein